MKRNRTKFRRGPIRVNYLIEDYDKHTLDRFREYLADTGIKDATIDNYMSSWKTNKNNAQTTKRHFHKFITSDKGERARIRKMKQQRFVDTKPTPNLSADDKFKRLFDKSKAKNMQATVHPSSGTLYVDCGDHIEVEPISERIEREKKSAELRAQLERKSERPQTKNKSLELLSPPKPKSDEDILKNRFEQIFALDMPYQYKLNFISTIILAECDSNKHHDKWIEDDEE